MEPADREPRFPDRPGARYSATDLCGYLEGATRSDAGVGEVFPKLEGTIQKADDPNALRVRYWALDTRTGRVVLNTAIEKSMIQYTVERNLAEGWVEIRLGRTGFRFSYQDEAKTAQPMP
jgi:hypothetical protein